jgi:hypothetical protein
MRYSCGTVLQEGEQADTSQQGGKAPKNPITGEPLTPVQNKDKEGYQATVLAGQSDETSARIMKQLDGQDGRPFGGRCSTPPGATIVTVICACLPSRARCIWLSMQKGLWIYTVAAACLITEACNRQLFVLQHTAV